MPRVLVCLDEVPASDGSCAVQAWQEVVVGLPPMTVEQAQQIGQHALLAWVTVGVVVLLRRAF